MIPRPAQACLPFLLALAPWAAAGDTPPPAFPSGQLAPVDVTLAPKEPSSWRMPTVHGTGEPPADPAPPDDRPVRINILTKEIPVRDPGENAGRPVQASDLKPTPAWSDPPEADQPAIPALTAATLLDPFVVRDDRYRRAQHAIDATRILDGHFDLLKGGRIATVHLGFINFDVGAWRHEQEGPSFGPPIPVVDLLKFTW